MILSGKKIVEERENGNIIIFPFNESKVNPNSYNLTLGNKLLIYKVEDYLGLDMKKDNPTVELNIPKEGLVLQPGILYLAQTNEITGTSKYVPMLEGRSSLARLGIQVHISAGFGDVGFSGHWTLEISVVQPVKIYPDIDICQIYYHEISGEYDLYDGKYNHNESVQSSKMYKDFE